MTAAETVQSKCDQLCSRGWIVTRYLGELAVGEVFNVCIKVTKMDTQHHGWAEVVKRMVPEQVYMVCGAKMLMKDGVTYLRVPGSTETTATILLPTREDNVVGVAAMFCGGISGWSRAALQLPAFPVVRLDHDGMAISTVLLNEPAEILFKEGVDQERFTLFWGEAIDLRWLQSFHDANVEVVCASPPCSAWGNHGSNGGFKDIMGTASWWQMVMIARLTQRRAFVVEASVAFAAHEDASTFDDVMRWAGYVVVWKGTLVDADKMVAAERTRYCMVYWNSADYPSAGLPFHMLNIGDRPKVPFAEAMWKNMPPEVWQATQIKPEQMAKITSRELLPIHQRRLPGSALHLRVVNPTKPLPGIPSAYHRVLDMPWPTLMKRGMYLPLVVKQGNLRLLNMWEVLKAIGLHGEMILPEPQDDATTLLAQALPPALALQVLGAVLAHRHEAFVSDDQLLRYLEAGLREFKKGWVDFDLLEQYGRNGWATLVMQGAEAERGPNGRLNSRLQGLQLQLDAMMRRNNSRHPPYLPESVRTTYEDMERDETREATEHRLFQVNHGYAGISINEDDPVQTIRQHVAEYMQVEANFLAVAKVNNKVGGMDRWIIAGEMTANLFDHALVLLDAGIPQAQWLPSELLLGDLTYYFQHGANPDVVELTGTWFFPGRCPWTRGTTSDSVGSATVRMKPGKNWMSLTRWKQTRMAPCHRPVLALRGQRAVLEMDMTRKHLLDLLRTLLGHPPRRQILSHQLCRRLPLRIQHLTRLTTAGSVACPFPMSWCQPSDQEHWSRRTWRRYCKQPTPATTNYASIQPPVASLAIYLTFQGRLMAVGQDDPRTLEQILLDEWGVPLNTTYFLLNGKVMGPEATCSCVPLGATVVAGGRLTGGTGNYGQKLRALLANKGVPDDQLDDRVKEIKKHIGDAGIRDAYSSFDPWMRLKSICPIRMIRESENKAKPKAKDIQKEPQNDELQSNDPWASALRERGSWKIDTAFFAKEDGSTPAFLDKVSHGSSGIALITEREAELLLQNQAQMSDNELAVVIIGARLQSNSRFTVVDVEIPCKCKDEARILVRAQLINLGAKRITLAGEDKKVTVGELDSAVLTCELVKAETFQREEICDGHIKYLRKQAETCFMMMRVKREAKDLLLRTITPGVYFSPKTEDGLPDPAYKVIWMPDSPLDDVVIKANSEPTAVGLVRNKGGVGIRVKTEDFIKAKQRWQPLWKPLPDTPYDLQIAKYFDLQNMPVSSSKAEVQAFLNNVKWPAIALRQTKPRSWIVGEAPGFMAVDSEASAALEDRLQKRMDQLHQEQVATTNMLREDFKNFQTQVTMQQQRQEQVNNQLQGSVAELAGSITSQLGQHMSQITAALSNQRNDLNSDIRTSQHNLNEDLMSEVRQQMASLRKRTPSPPKDGPAKQPKQ
ncbi:unnamed protein product [Symbiodinium sp. CCMP2456]|nr:unnamed protein product [Symbiodinium sp. CCMP2456]